MGRIGIPLNDFLLMTPREFSAVYEAWNEHQTLLRQERWEQIRWICFYSIKPYSKKGLRPENVLSFGWGGNKAGKKRTKAEKKQEQKEFKKLVKLWDNDDE